MLTVNRRKTVVIVNDSNRYGFVSHGLKSKDYKHLNEFILQGIRDCFLDEKMKEEIIEQYLQTAGAYVFTKTRGAKYVARLNKACGRVEFFSENLDPNTLIQSLASRQMNNDLPTYTY